MRTTALAAAALAAALAAAPQTAIAQGCDIDRPIVFAGLDYDSARFHNAVARLILEQGFGCKTDDIPGAVIPLVSGLARGDVDVVMEIWTANPVQVWTDAVAAGTAVSLGTNFPDAREAWYVPSYLVEGDGAPASGLVSVDDLPKFAELFSDPEEPAKGRFYNCPAGWQCEVVNTKKLAAYGLEASYTNFRSGTGEALAAAVEGAVRRERPILFYYWGPTWLLGKYAFTALEEPGFDKAVWDAMTATERPAKATAYPVSDVIVGANKAFVDAAPTVAAFLEAYETTSADVSQALAYMQDNKAEPADAARWFLKEKPEAWKGWVPADVADKVRAGL